MAKRQKTKAFSIQGFDAEHYKTTDAYTRAVGNLFDRATNDVAMGLAKLNVDPNKPFQFSDYPTAQATMKRVANKLAKSITAVVADGSRKQWLFACKKNDEFVASIMDTSKLSKARLNKMQDRNLDSLKTFQDRKVDGMNLSQRVWKYTEQFKAQIEAGLDVGLGEGRSAQELSRDLRQNLKEPNRLFRRVRDKRGNLQLSKNAQAFHPGQGVYRSSYKNAMRLTRSEVNMAYREADWLRWQQLDFVIGFEVHRTNHEPQCKCSLCERLKGRYPKTFKFKGWHPQCMCYVTPILTTDEEFDAQELSDLKAALRGTERKQLATKQPEYDGMKALEQWAKDNQDAQANWGSTPYFIKDNFNGGLLSNGLKAETIKAVETPKIDPIQQQLDQLQPSIAAIKQMASEWGFDTSPVDNALANRNPQGVINAISEIRNRINNAMNELKSFIEDAANTIKQAKQVGVDSTDMVNALTEINADKRNWIMPKMDIKQILVNLKNKIKSLSITDDGNDSCEFTFTLADEQKVNIGIIANDLKNGKMIVGKPMTHKEANSGNCNPKYAEEYIPDSNGIYTIKKTGERLSKNPDYIDGYDVNCQTCTMVYLARKMGLNIEAVANKRNSVYKYLNKCGVEWQQRFQNKDGSKVAYSYYKTWAQKNGKNIENRNIPDFFESQTKEKGIYEIYCEWKGKGAHVFLCIRNDSGKLVYYDSQNNKVANDYYTRMRPSSVMILRIDDKIFNPVVSKLFLKK